VSTRPHRLGEICTFIKGTYPIMKTEPGQYPLVVTASFRRTANSYQIEGRAVCIPLISSTGHGDAALNRLHYQEGRFALANLLVALLPKAPAVYCPKYLFYLLNAKKDALLVPLMQGTANVSLKVEEIAGVEVFLPPLTEQQQIVARIEELVARLADAKRLREHSKAECNALQRAHLTKEFKHLADAYPVRALKEVSLDISDGPHKTPSYVDAGIPFVTVKNMVSGTLDLTDVQYVTPKDHQIFNRRSRAEKGDVLYSKDGATRGRPCFIETDTPFSFFVSVALIKPRRELLDGRYLCHLLNSGRIRERMHLQSRGDMIPHIVLSEIRKFPVPIPPLPEQRRVVAYLDALQGKVDALKALQEKTGAELDALLPSILEKAFRGEL
jgi:type I restriction enzyme S subunit